MQKIKVLLLSLFVVLFFVGCEENNSDVVSSGSSSTYLLKTYPSGGLVITSASQSSVVEVSLEDTATNTPVAGEVITLDYFDLSKGSMNSFSATTDSNGKAVFNYTAPNDITNLSSLTLTFRVESQSSVTSTLTISYDSTVVTDPKYAYYKLKAYPEDNITITQGSQSIDLQVYLEDTSTGKPVAGEVVIVDFFDSTKGSMSSFTGTTDTVGKISFTYTSPQTIASLTSLDITFRLKADLSKYDTVNVAFAEAIDPAIEVPKLVLDKSTIDITTNGQTVNVSIKVFNNDLTPYSGGNVNIKYPEIALTGKDVGSFDTFSAPVVNGQVNFVYTAPNPLSGDETFEFIFYHDSQPILSEKILTLNIKPDADQIVLSNYSLKSIYDTTMDLDTTKQMTFYIYNEETGSNIDDASMTSVKVTVLNPSLASLEDTAGNTGSSLTVNSKNNVQMNLKTNTISGIVPIEVVADFKDANDAAKTITRVFNVVILSGPPTAMSLSYAGTSQNSANAKFIENWVLTVTDKYNNLVNTSPAVSMGMLTGYATSSAATANSAGYLYYSTSDGGTLKSDDTFTAGSNVFDNVDLVNDKLVTFGTGYVFNASGKWDIDSKVASDKLSLVDDFNGSDVSALGFAVGHNFRNQTCDGSAVVANVYPQDTNILGSTGSMIINVEYDYYLVGKSVMLWNNLVGSDNNTDVKVGIAKKITLRGSGLTGETYSFAKGFSGVIRLNVNISSTVEYYKNANFGYQVEVSGDDVDWEVSDDSMNHGITDCGTNGGVAFVDVNITSDAPNAGTVSLTNVLVGSEF